MQPYDAGHEREWLAEEYARWTAAGFLDSHAAKRFHRRAKRLAKVLGMTHDEVMETIKQDAQLIEEEV